VGIEVIFPDFYSQKNLFRKTKKEINKFLLNWPILDKSHPHPVYDDSMKKEIKGPIFDIHVIKKKIKEDHTNDAEKWLSYNSMEASLEQERNQIFRDYWEKAKMKLSPSEDGVSINVCFKNETYLPLKYFQVKQQGVVKQMIFQFALGPGEKKKQENIASSIPWIITDTHDNIFTIFEFPNIPVHDSSDFDQEESSESQEIDWVKGPLGNRHTTVTSILFGGGPSKRKQEESDKPEPEEVYLIRQGEWFDVRTDDATDKSAKKNFKNLSKSGIEGNIQMTDCDIAKTAQAVAAFYGDHLKTTCEIKGLCDTQW
jgi:hypothetical protein